MNGITHALRLPAEAALRHAAGVRASAVLSPCGTYRYALERDWTEAPAPGEPAAVPGEPAAAPRTALFVLLNPSTADAERDDPTLRRCLAFARDLGCTRLLVGNLFALRATDPAALGRAADPVGPDADAWLERCAAQAHVIVAGWGAHAARRPERRDAVLELLARNGRIGCLGLTRDGHPRHPLYLPRAARLLALPGGSRSRCSTIDSRCRATTTHRMQP